jgi:hypothetical protein
MAVRPYSGGHMADGTGGLCDYEVTMRRQRRQRGVLQLLDGEQLVPASRQQCWRSGGMWPASISRKHALIGGPG